MSTEKIKLVSSLDGQDEVRVIELKNEEQRAILLFEVLGVEYYSSTQLMDAMRYVNKLMGLGMKFRELVMDLSLIMGNGEKFYQLNICES